MKNKKNVIIVIAIIVIVAIGFGIFKISTSYLFNENGKIEDEAKFDSLIMKLIREAKKNERAE